MSSIFELAVTRGCASGNAYALASELLKACETEREELFHLGGREVRQLGGIIESVTPKVTSWFEGVDGQQSVQLFEDDADDILESTTQWCADLGVEPRLWSALSSRAWVDGLCAALKQNLWLPLLSAGSAGSVFYPGQAAPVCEPEIKSVFGSELLSHPDRLGPPSYGAKWLALIPTEARPYCVRVFVDLAGTLRGINSKTKAGVGLVLDSFDDLVLSLDDDKGSIRCRGPSRPDVLQKRISEALDDACARHVDILVLPELCLDDSTLALLRERHQQRKLPKVLMAGSRYAPVRGRDRNRAAAFIGPREFHHDKNNPFSTRTKLQEDIETRPAEITVVMSGTWSVAPMICKDLLEPGAGKLLTTLRARMVLVSALSSSLEAFKVPTRQIAAMAQGMCVIANATDRADELVGLVSTPTPHPDVTFSVPPRDGDRLRIVRLAPDFASDQY